MAGVLVESYISFPEANTTATSASSYYDTSRSTGYDDCYNSQMLPSQDERHVPSKWSDVSSSVADAIMRAGGDSVVAKAVSDSVLHFGRHYERKRKDFTGDALLDAASVATAAVLEKGGSKELAAEALVTILNCTSNK
mmetsp:Transcript_44611/g.54000  ORF Transcript_44611/g.54000 Transcript_44611/m.54000 type:complete len:138 (+) Transcript_44611:3-416(+)